MPLTEQELKDFGSQPKSASSDAGSIARHSLQEQIALDKYLAAKKATTYTKLPFRIFKQQAGGGE